MVDQPHMDQVRERRRSLYQATLELEGAVASPVANTMVWRDRVLAAGKELVSRIESHAREVEEPDGFLETIVTDAPSLANAARRLEGEHEQLLEQAKQVVQDTGALSEGSDADAADAIRDIAMELLGRLVRHRQRGADLIYQAYTMDVGSSE